MIPEKTCPQSAWSGSESKASDRDWIRREGEAFYGGYYGIPAMSVT